MEKLFKSIIEGFCQIYKMDPAPVLAGCTLEMNGLKFSLLHNNDEVFPLLMAYCDFGMVPKELEAQAYKKLLEANLSAYTGQGETFCMGSDGRVVFVNNYPLEALTPEILAGNLAMITLVAQKWREGYFLDSDEKSKKSSRNEFLMKNFDKAGK